MSVFFTGPIEVNKGIVKDSSISNCDVDMNNKKISTLGDPSLPQDAVNLRTLQQNVTNVTVTLSGTSSVLLSNKLFGSFYITISGVNDNLATAVFSISKSNSSFSSLGNRLSHSGSGDLELVWGISSGIFLKKNSITQDGDYIIKII